MEENTPNFLEIEKVSNGYIVTEKGSYKSVAPTPSNTKVYESIHTLMDYLLNNFNVSDNDKTNQN